MILKMIKTIDKFLISWCRSRMDEGKKTGGRGGARPKICNIFLGVKSQRKRRGSDSSLKDQPEPLLAMLFNDVWRYKRPNHCVILRIFL
jgi:hypothetical protein